MNHQLETSYFKNLDALRFFSFLGVFLSHTWQQPAATDGFVDFLETLVTLNYLGVPFFFTLSSFLITYRLLVEKNKHGSVKLFRFYKNRTLRIWPAYYMLVLFCFLILPILSSLFNVPATLPPVLPFVLFYVNFYIIEHGSAFTFALSILWSISIEEQFYFVWGVVLKFLSTNFLAVFICMLFAGSITFSYYYLHIQHKPPNNLAIHSLYVLQNFCTGALMALFCIQKRKVFAYLQNLPTLCISTAYFLLPVAYFFIEDMILINIIKSICYSLIIYDQVFNEQRFFNAGKSVFINYLGKISYGLYLYHALVFVGLQKLFGFFSYDQPGLLINLLHICIAFIITFVVAHISYRYIESKFLALKS